jgi:hypothetical protein
VPCSSNSSKWKLLKGRCERSKCAQFCMDEGNTGGYCKGRRIQECVCSSNECAADGGEGKPKPAPAPGGAVEPPPPGNGGGNSALPVKGRRT